MLTVLLGSVLKFEGRFILQTQTDGPVRMLVVDFRTPGSVRALRPLRQGRASPPRSPPARTIAGALLGHGHLAMTIDQGPDTSRYQGLVALEGKDLEHAAHEYFLRSEQIPTRVRLAVGEEFSAGADGARHRWRAGGMLLQFLPKDAGARAAARSRSGRRAGGHRAARGRRGRCLGRGPLAGRDRRGRRADRSGGLGRAAALPAVPRARRARVPQPRRSPPQCSCSRDERRRRC